MEEIQDATLDSEESVTAGLQALSLSTPAVDPEAQTLQAKVHNAKDPASQDYVKRAFLQFSRSLTWQDDTAQQDGSHVVTFSPLDSQVVSMSAICGQWYRAVEAGKPYWLEIPPNQLLTMERSSPKPTQLTSLQVLDVARVSFGCFLDHSTFISHWTEEYDDYDELYSQYMKLHLEHDIQSLSLYLCVDIPCEDTGGPTEKLIIPYSGIENFVLVCSRNSGDLMLFFPLNSVPRCFKEKTSTNRFGDEFVQEDRILSFSSCTPDIMGSSSVLAVHIIDNSADGSVTEDVLHRLQKVGFDIYFSSTRVEEARQSTAGLDRVNDFRDFSVTYALQCLLSRGYKVSDRVLPSFFSNLEAAVRQDPIATAAALHQVADGWVDRDCFCDLEAAFLTELDVARTVGSQNDADDLPDHYVYARKVVVTPTQMLFLKPEPIVENRVVREYGVDNFIRVAFRDEDFNKLTAPNPNSIKCVTSRVKDVLQRGIRIGGRQFEYLGSSNSQMREHGCWMYSAAGGMTAAAIRGWMGDLSHERCVATYVSRLGQFFSSSRDAVKVSVEDRSVALIGDVMSSSRKYTFSDGIGKISVPLAEKVADALGVSPVPSAFQIRYGGCKGVLAQDPTLGDTDLIHIRDSMKKFDSEHKTLEVTSVTTPGALSLNRQAITLLSGLGVPDAEFFKLQERVLNQLAEMLLLDAAAVKALSGARVGINFQALHNSGISLTTEPFFRSMLLAVYRNQMGELLRRTRIQLPAGEGRIMMGTMDETDRLQYGQVFLQYSRDTDKAQAEKVVHEGQVTVTKNPCFHPGDMRKFTAVDVPELRHMVDCIVFPSRGRRPHPDEMSGSDLDGDMYFVTWREGLILPRENVPAMDFTAQPKRVLCRPVDVSDMIEFFAEYIKNDQLGLIANAHLVHADKEANGIFSQKCKELAQLHSDAVDFPKTGQCPELKGDLRPDKYPDFMMKSDKPQYRSEKIIGKLFRQCQALDNAQRFSPVPVVEDDGVDQDLFREGFQSYTDDAQAQLNIYNTKIRSIMSLYGIASEGEVVSGCILKVKQRLGLLRNERFEVTEYVRARFKTLWRKTRAEFFRQFEEAELPSDRRREEQLKKASAWYVVTYSDDYNNKPHGASPKLLSFPWVVHDVLGGLKKSAHGLEPGEVYQEDMNKAVVSISRSVKGHSDFQLTRIQEARTKQEELFRKIQAEVERVVDGVKLTLIGPGLTRICDDNSTVEIFISQDDGAQEEDVSDQQMLNSVFHAIKSKLKEATHVKAGEGLTFLFKTGPKTKSTVHMTSSLLYLRRTAYINLHTARRPDLLAVIHVLMDWARKFRICGKSRDDIVPEEVLILLFLSFAETHGFIPKVLDPDTQAESQAIIRGSPSTPPAGDHSTVDGVLLLKFFEHFSSISKEELLKLSDPSTSVSRPLLEHISQAKKKKLRDNMLHAYHDVAQSAGVLGLLGRQMTTPGHLVLNLSRESFGSVMHAEEFNAIRLSDKTGAQVAIRRRMFRDTVGLILEAWGDQEALRRVEEEVEQMEMKSKHVVPTFSLQHSYVEGGHTVLFEGYASPSDKIRIQSYNGERNPDHDKKTLASPYLFPGSTGENGADFDLFLKTVRRQGKRVSDDHDESMHGELRAIARYGNVYMYNTSHVPPTMTVEEFDRDLNKGHRTADDFLKKYNVSCRFERRVENTFILDKDLKFLEYRLSDVKWMALDLKRRPRSSIHPFGTDIRFKIQSRRILRGDELEKSEEYRKFLDPNHKVLEQGHGYGLRGLHGEPDLRIHPDYRGKVHFARRKLIRRFRAADDVQHSRFRTDVEVRLTEVCEYSRPDPSGHFSSVIPGRQEVTVIPPLPDWTSPEEVETFAREYWQFCLELGDTLYP
ncbi:hypothetical protein Bbelb_356040 [Branchiostoma belcheri]|nr:hypothetical protein Bbelb_356040 [Branchiostoma belcheri]